MIVLSLDAATAEQVVSNQQTVVTYPSVTPAVYPSLRMLYLPDLVGQPVAIARLAPEPFWPDSGGAIVGSATVKHVEQISPEYEGFARRYPDLQVDFAPGRWAVILTDAAPCEQRCPSCYGKPWRKCNGSAPWPYDHPGPISEWTP